MIVKIKYFGWMANINADTDFACVCRDHGHTTVACGQIDNGHNWYFHPIYDTPGWFFEILHIVNKYSDSSVPNWENEFLNAVSGSEIISYTDAHVSIEF